MNEHPHDTPGDVLADWWTGQATRFANTVLAHYVRLQEAERNRPDSYEADAARSRLRIAWARYRAFLSVRPDEVDVRGIEAPPANVVDLCAERFGFDPWGNA